MDLYHHFESKKPSKKSIAFRSLVSGVGVNDAPFITAVEIDGKLVTHPAFITWRNMLLRCYKFDKVKRPTYDGVTVCNQWLMFSEFYNWWKVNFVNGWHLDKDILSDDRIYSPDNCIYIPQWLNSFLNGHGRSRGDSSIGVTFQKDIGRYRAQCSDPINGGRGYIGVFLNHDDAFMAWLKRKVIIASMLKPLMDEIDCRIYERVIKKINMMG